MLVFGQLQNLVQTWNPQYIVIDATGVGEGLWAMLDKSFPGRVMPVKFSSQVKSEMGWRFLAIIETGRCRDCTRTATSGSSALRLPPEGQTPLYDKVLAQYMACQSEILPGPGKLLRWGVPEGARAASGELIHDDYLLADALITEIDQLEWAASTDLSSSEGFEPLDVRRADQPPSRHIDDMSRRWPDV